MVFRASIHYTNFYLPKDTPLEVISWLMKAQREHIGFLQKDENDENPTMVKYIADDNQIRIEIVSDELMTAVTEDDFKALKGTMIV